MPTKKRLCRGCEPHPYQDKRLGRKVRVKNIMHGQSQRPEDVKGYRCTVCGKEERRE